MPDVNRSRGDAVRSGGGRQRAVQPLLRRLAAGAPHETERPVARAGAQQLEQQGRADEAGRSGHEQGAGGSHAHFSVHGQCQPRKKRYSACNLGSVIVR